MKRTMAIIAAVAATAISAAQVAVEQSIDSVAIFIGQQARMSLSVTAKDGAKVAFPSFGPSQYITPGVEVLSATGDTAEADGGMKRITKTYVLTSFDGKLYPLPALKVKVDGKEYSGRQLALKVVEMEVDTLHPNNFFPPKDVRDNPFDWAEWAPALWLSLLAALLSVGALWTYARMRQGKPIVARIRIVKKLLPQQKAMQSIEKIKEEHLSTSGDQKEYYTRLTNTLRTYIEERFGFNAMEMTSGEIITMLNSGGDATMIDELRELFATADLVKFAKYSALMNENDLSLVRAVGYIDSTKQDGLPTEERVEPELSEDDRKAAAGRKAAKWLAAALAAAATAAVAYVAHTLWGLIG